MVFLLDGCVKSPKPVQTINNKQPSSKKPARNVKEETKNLQESNMHPETLSTVFFTSFLPFFAVFFKSFLPFFAKPWKLLVILVQVTPEACSSLFRD